MFLIAKRKLKSLHAPRADVFSISCGAKIFSFGACVVDHNALAKGALLQCRTMRLPAIKESTYDIKLFAYLLHNKAALPLDKDIRNIVEVIIESDLQAPKVPKKRVPKLKQVWKCEHVHDFLYGHRIGYYKGLAEGLVLERHKRQLSDDEANEVDEIIELYARGLRKYFVYYKEEKKKLRRKS
jgi:hypothetical protein